MLAWLFSHFAFASWNPFALLFGKPKVAEVAAKPEESWDWKDWAIAVLLILLPFGILFYILKRFGVFRKLKSMLGFGTKRRKRRATGVAARAKSIFRRRRSSGTARQKQLAALARGRATRRRNARAKKK